MSKSEKKNIKDAALTNFPNLEKTKPNLSTVENIVPQYRKQGHEREREISSFILKFSLRADRSYSKERRDFTFLYYGDQMQRSD